MYEIESNIPLPRRMTFHRSPSPIKGLLAMLEIGESFVMPISEYRSHNSATASIHTTARNIQIKVVTRKIDAETMRVWRIG